MGWGITPTVAKDAEWRSQVAWNYSGIAFGAAVVVEILLRYINRPRKTLRDGP